MPLLHVHELDQMRPYLAPEHEGPSMGNLLPFDRSFRNEPNSGSRILDLIDEAGQRIAKMNRFAAGSLARVDLLARQALEQLSAAERRVAKAEADRAETEAALEQLRDQLEREFVPKLEQLERLKEQATVRIALAEDKAREAEARAHSAEERAQAVEEIFERIERAVKSKILNYSTFDAANIWGTQPSSATC
jgi:DNA repair exonuclease SbcCD ATPase subunit